MQHEPYYSSTSVVTKETPLIFKDTSLWWITICVLLAHGLAFWFASIASPLKETVKQKVVVKTVQLQPRSQTLNPITKPSTPKATLPQQKPAAASVIPETLPEIKPESLIAKQEKIPVSVPAKAEEVVPLPPPQIVEPAKPLPTPQPEIAEPPKVIPTPEKVPEKPKDQVAAPKKVQQPKKEEKKAEIPKTPKAAPPKPEPVKKAPASAKKTPAQAPVQKPASEVKKKPPQKKEPTAEEIAAREAEKARQQEIAVAKARQQELLATAKENIVKLSETRDKINVGKVASWDETAIPGQLENLQIDALPVGTGMPVELSAKEVSYRDEVAYRLKQALLLPDYGSVKIKLTLNRSGKVSSVVIVSSESAKNKQYAERILPSLIFPPFGTRFADASQYTFLITLNNDH